MSCCVKFLAWDRQFNLFLAILLAKFYLSAETADNTLNLYVMLDFIPESPKLTICPSFSLIPGNLSGIKSGIKYVLTF